MGFLLDLDARLSLNQESLGFIGVLGLDLQVFSNLVRAEFASGMKDVVPRSRRMICIRIASFLFRSVFITYH